MQTRYKSIVLILTAGLVFGAAHAFFAAAAALNNQTITFPANSNKTYGVAPFAVDPTASSGLAVSFAPLASPVCAVSGNTDTIVAAGTCTIQPSQSGNGNYAAALNINQSFTAKQATLGMPTSADFFLKAYDPRKHNYAYATFKRLPDGRGIVFGG